MINNRSLTHLLGGKRKKTTAQWQVVIKQDKLNKITLCGLSVYVHLYNEIGISTSENVLYGGPI